MRLPVPKRDLIAAAATLASLVLAAALVPALVTAAVLPSAVATTAALLVTAVGMTILLAGGQIDLSVAEQLTIGGAVTTALVARDVPLPLIAPIVLLVGAVLGALNGALVVVLGFPALVITFATSIVYGQGLRWVLAPAPVRALPRASLWFGRQPAAGAALLAMIGLAVLAVSVWAWRRSSWVRTRSIAYPARGPQLTPFSVMGALAALAGFVLVIRGPSPALDSTVVMVRVIAAALVGAAATGRFAPLSALWGTIFVAALASALALVPRLAPWAATIEAAVLLVALAAGGAARRARGWPALLAAFPAVRGPPDPHSRRARLLGLALLVGTELAVVGIFGRNFTTLLNFADIARLTIEIALIALPAAWILAAGGTELSAPGIMAVAPVVLAFALKPGGMALPLLAALGVALAFGVAAGGGNGLLVAGLRLPSGLVTFTSAALLRGAAEALAARWRTASVALPPALPKLARHLVFGVVPRPFVVLAVLAAAFDLARRAAERRAAAPSSRRALAVLHTSAGLLAAVAAVLVIARRGAIQPDTSASFALYALTASVLGGAGTPGIPSVAGPLLGSLAVAILVNGLPLALVTAPLVSLSIAVLLLTALGVAAASGRSP